MRDFGHRRALACATVGMLLATLLAVSPGAAGAGEGEAPPAQDTRAWVEGQLILTLFPALPPTDWIEELIEDPGGVVQYLRPVQDFIRVCAPRAGFGSILVAQFPDEASALTAAERLRADRNVQSVARNHYVAMSAAGSVPAPPPTTGPVAPSDADFPKQWALRNTGQVAGNPGTPGVAGHDIRALPAWQRSTGQGQVIAVLDQGMDISHPDLASNVWLNTGELPGNGVDDEGNGWVDDVHGWNVGDYNPHPRPWDHGTSVAGIAAAATNNGMGVAGVAPHAKLMPVDFIGYGDPGTVTEINALGAFAYAIANGATVINNSWGFIAPVGLGSPLMTLAVRCASQANIVIAWSAGNLNVVPESWPAYYPADNVLLTSSFTNEGCQYVGAQPNPALVDVVAPGVDIWAPESGNRYDWFGGTSAAAPHTAGVAALVRAAFPDLTAQEVAVAVRMGADRRFIEPWSRSIGFLSAEGALASAANGGLPPELPGTDPTQSSLFRCYVEDVSR